MTKIRVAIDGPAGSGKSSISREVAKQLGFTHLDTGAMYRAVALKCINKNFNFEEDSYEDIIANTKIEQSHGVTKLDGVDVSAEVRQDEVTKNTKYVASNPLVRDFLKEVQREISKQGNIILDGRDIASNVLPDAEVKIYLTASIDVRASRRFKQKIETGEDVNLDKLKEEIKKRDFEDENREYAPLIRVEEAIFMDTSDMTFDEVIQNIKDIIEERSKK